MRLVRYTYPDRTLAPAAFLRNPWADLDRLFTPSSAETPFATEAEEDKDKVVVRADLPGVAKEDVTVELTGDVLTISAVRKGRGENAEAVTYRRAFRVTEGVQADKTAATLENGVLTVTLPKAEALKPRQITIS